MNILIIEDEERSFTRLKRLLLNIDDTLDIFGPLTSVCETTRVLKEEGNKYDILFADIRLDDGEVFDAFLEAMPTVPVIFTTAYNEYALEAFRSNGIAYLQKPIVPQELEIALAKARKLIAYEDASLSKIDYSGLLASLGAKLKQSFREHYLVQNADGYTVLSVHNISHIATENGVTRAYLNTDGHSVVLNYPLGDIEAQLDPSRFFRANRQYIIGIDSIERLHFSFNSKLTVKLRHYPDVSIVVSKERASQLKEWIDR